MNREQQKSGRETAPRRFYFIVANFCKIAGETVERLARARGAGPPLLNSPLAVALPVGKTSSLFTNKRPFKGALREIGGKRLCAPAFHFSNVLKMVSTGRDKVRSFGSLPGS